MSSLSTSTTTARKIPPMPKTATMTNDKSYKGKYTRSWQQLPPEIIRLIATFVLLDVGATGYCPKTWDAKEMWQGRLVFSTMRDALELEKLMFICPSWQNALETHLFWQKACAIIDPNDYYAHNRIVHPSSTTAGSNALIPSRLTNYRHFRNISNVSCLVCRTNYPHSNMGFGNTKRIVHNPFLGGVLTCREHRKTTFCGLCLREAPPLDADAEYGMVCCVENEDEETWPHVEATCRQCRVEGLWNRASRNPIDRDAVGGRSFNSADWETRQTVEGFVDLGEGTIGDVLNIAREKFWLRRYTKLSDMLLQAVAASKYATRAENGQTGYGSDDDMSEDEDDAELLSLTEDAGGVKEISIADWARSRILDGFWISPADLWYANFVLGRSPVVPAQHPCPWNRDAAFSGALEDGEGAGGEELQHPRPRTFKTDIPPTFHLCEQTYHAFQRQMRNILLPAMTNIVRRLVIECTADRVDPATKAARMSMEDVAQELRDEAVWFNGIDWLERRANRAKEERERLRTQTRTSEEDDASSSSRSDGSHTTSPVLSTTTLQTTPSPPPSGDTSCKEDESEDCPMVTTAPAIPIPVSPVLKSPQLIHPIPYIPVTVSQSPPYSLEAFRIVWREACAPLYHCRCTVCERAIIRANIEAGNIIPTQATTASTVQPTVVQPVEKSVLIKIDDVSTEAVREEEEEDDSIIDDGESEKESEYESSVTADSPTLIPASRKRSSADLDDDAAPEIAKQLNIRSGTPPKRAKVEGTYSPSSTHLAGVNLRKRPSEELEDDHDDTAVQNRNGDAKRLKSNTPLPLPRPGKAKVVVSKS